MPPTTMSSHTRQSLASFAMYALGFVTLTLVWKRYQQESSSFDEEDDSYSSREDDADAAITELELPPHMIREMHKEKRRKLSIRWMAMKKPMYDNIEMYDPTGTLLCTIAEKKAKWYVRKKLAKWLDLEGTKIQLLFTPKGKSVQGNQTYNTSRKKNICVVCSDDKDHMRHYIIPYSYRTLLPSIYKSHMPHDVVILCPDCHLPCEQATQRRQKFIEGNLRKDPSTADPFIVDRELYCVRSRALALLKQCHKLPPARIEEYQSFLRKHYNLSEEESLTEDILQKATNVETQSPNPKYVPGANLVVQSLQSDQDIEEFIRAWRRHFVETTAPRFLPRGWDVDNPVHSDSRTE